MQCWPKMLNRSFSRRIGKSLSPLQQSLLGEDLPKCLLDPLALPKYDRYIAEIGIGMADHFVAKAALDPSTLYIGFEPYLNGVANAIKLAKDAEAGNLLLWPDDMDLVFDQLPNDLLSEIYILFPDPWPKLRHHKRRIINPTRLKLFTSKLKANGRLYFASDIAHYFNSAQEIIGSTGLFKEIYSGPLSFENYIKTRYHLKAEEENRAPQFLCVEKR